MSTLEKLLSVVTVSSAADVHVEPVSYFYTDDKGAKKEFKTEVGVIKRVPMALSSRMENINQLQTTIFSTRVSQYIRLLEGDVRVLTPEQVDSMDSDFVEQLMRAIAKHHPKLFPHLSEKAQGEKEAGEATEEDAKKN